MRIPRFAVLSLAAVLALTGCASGSPTDAGSAGAGPPRVACLEGNLCNR